MDNLARAATPQPAPALHHARRRSLLWRIHAWAALIASPFALAAALSGDAKLAMLTCKVADPTGYGRILRDPGNRSRVVGIVEHKDANAAQRAIRDGSTQYTDACGLRALRERISSWYAQRFALDIAPERIVVTAGASAALQLACLALIDAGDEILMPDPSYPCNRQFVQAAGGTAVLLPSGPEARFQLSADQVRAAWGGHTRGVLLASPSNPTGTSIARDELLAIARAVHFGARVLILDEPTAALGVKQATHVLRIVNEAKRRGLAVIFITHQVMHAMAVGDHFAVLIRGAIASDFRKGEKTREEITDLMAGGETMATLEAQIETYMNSHDGHAPQVGSH